MDGHPVGHPPPGSHEFATKYPRPRQECSPGFRLQWMERPYRDDTVSFGDTDGIPGLYASTGQP